MDLIFHNRKNLLIVELILYYTVALGKRVFLCKIKKMSLTESKCSYLILSNYILICIYNINSMFLIFSLVSGGMLVVDRPLLYRRST